MMEEGASLDDTGPEAVAAFVPAYAPVLSPRGAAIALLALMFLSALIGAAADTREREEPLVWTFVSGFLSSFLSFYWFRLGREQRGWPRSRWLSTAIVFLTPLAVPWYIARSRPRGRKLRGVLRFFGYVLLMLVVSMAGGLLALLVS
ncbi:hypothetical protein ACSUZJ_11470 [Telluria sp. B2]